MTAPEKVHSLCLGGEGNGVLLLRFLASLRLAETVGGRPGRVHKRASPELEPSVGLTVVEDNAGVVRHDQGRIPR